jgi:hypothetical protein
MASKLACYATPLHNHIDAALILLTRCDFEALVHRARGNDGKQHHQPQSAAAVQAHK